MIMVMNDETCFEINISSKETHHTLDRKWLKLAPIYEFELDWKTDYAK